MPLEASRDVATSITSNISFRKEDMDEFNEANLVPDFQNDIEQHDGNLQKLPNDEYEKILSYLSPEDKKNLKLASKTCERRVNKLDPAMKKWRITFWEDTLINTMVNLMKAKTRHLLDGTINDIQLSLNFYQIKGTLCLMSDSITNHWKENIVSLDLRICGAEFFLQDPLLYMPQLKCLRLWNYEDSSKGLKDYDDNKSLLASSLIEKQADTLEDLELFELNVEINKILNLKNFTAVGVDGKLVASVLKCSSTSLETLKCVGLKDFPEDFSCPLLKIKSFEINGNPSFKSVTVITTASQSSLKKLLFTELDEEFMNQWDSIMPKLNIEYLKVESCSVGLITKALISFSLTLKDLDIDSPEGTYQQFSLPCLKLNKLNAWSTQGTLIRDIISSSKNTIKVLDLSYVDTDIEFDSSTKLKLQYFNGNNLTTNCINSILLAAQQSLQELIIDYPYDTELFNHKLPNIVKLGCRYMTTDQAESLITASQSTLRYLELCSLSGNSFSFTNKNLQLDLISLECFVTASEVVTAVLKSLRNPLQSLKLYGITTKFDINILQIALETLKANPNFVYCLK